ncbi:MAG: hypothetical protein ABI323_12915 [Solirubrobacteraceae bacterium]
MSQERGMTDDTLDITTAGDLSPQASNLDALMVEVSLTAGRGTITVCGHDDDDPELVAIRPLASRLGAQASDSDWEGHADAVIFGWLLSP